MNKTYETLRFNANGEVKDDGEYFLTPFLQENGKHSFWLSKTGFTCAQYCFSLPGADTYAEQIAGIKGYISLFQTMHEQPLHIFAYEIPYGDKGIIVAASYEEAAQIFKNRYAAVTIRTDADDDCGNGAYLFEEDIVKRNTLYNAFPW